MTQHETAQLIALLKAQQQLLEKIASSLDKSKLGLHNDVGSLKIYCNRQHGSLWYTLKDGQASPITATALSGYLKELKFEQTERRGKPCHKLLATIAADKLYILESGHDTHFSKGLLVAVALLTPQQLLQPITIQPVAGDDESVLFCRVWCGSEYIKASYDDSVNWREIAKAAIAVVKAANEMPF
ncbi:hypothetical protein F7734_53510 [Scytonema sp. UIC 10036]|uniref:hypothetical protein n=1 Tax=Scytonema sp. UIC 10036 TaxID=2304196 RepID=UPI0012DA7558|nr:hypothetical protein [Scytonema sp. UIC 10036]MUH00626.1 hypothetical protein [Scytonema sp. UIC 10036]